MVKRNLALLALAICANGTFFLGNTPSAFSELNTKQKEESKQLDKIYSFSATALDGKPVDLSQYKGKVLLVVNTASHCGFTPQYAGLEELYKKYKDRGLEILGFPCNQFGKQEPGNSSEIASFCQKNYGVDFQMFEKIDVNGAHADPIYKYLTAAAPGLAGTKKIKWNFTKFLVDRTGKPIARFAPNVKPENLEAEIEKVL